MEIEIKEDDDEVINVIVKGDVDIYTSKDFKNTLFELSQTRDKNIDIDFSQVEYMDSTGIGVLMSLYKIQTTKGRKLIISKVNADIINFIKLSNLTYLLDQ